MSTKRVELIFPSSIISELQVSRGPAWSKLVTTIINKSNYTEQTAFALMMAKLNNCGCCNSDSFRSLEGCITCSKQTLKRFRGHDDELVNLYEISQLEVLKYLQKP